MPALVVAPRDGAVALEFQGGFPIAILHLPLSNDRPWLWHRQRRGESDFQGKQEKQGVSFHRKRVRARRGVSCNNSTGRCACRGDPPQANLPSTPKRGASTRTAESNQHPAHAQQNGTRGLGNQRQGSTRV